MLVLVRHGRTAANASGLLLGRADPPLDEHGRAQAAALAAAVADARRVVSSPAAAGPGDGRRPRPPRRGRRAAGWSSTTGSSTGARIADVPADLWRRWRADVDFAPPGRRVAGRPRAGGCGPPATTWPPRRPRRDVVVVSHVSPIKAAVAWALGVGDELSWRLHVAPASVTRIAVRDGRGVLTALQLDGAS